MEHGDEPEDGKDLEGAAASENKPKAVHRALAITLIPAFDVCQEVKALLRDKKVKVKDITDAIAKDPALVLEVLKAANSVKNAPGRAQISSTKTAVISLGLDAIAQIADQALLTPYTPDTELDYWYNAQKTRCMKTAGLARVIAGFLARNSGDDCYTAGLLLFTGDLVAVLHFRQRYVEIAKKFGKRSRINHRLFNDLNFDVDEVGNEFLKHHGIPMRITNLVQREAVSLSSEAGLIRSICFAAGEMAECFEVGKWATLAPGKKIPPKSWIRMLRIDDHQYSELYKRATSFLSSGEMVDEVDSPEDESILTSEGSVAEGKQTAATTSEVSAPEDSHDEEHGDSVQETAPPPFPVADIPKIIEDRVGKEQSGGATTDGPILELDIDIGVPIVIASTPEENENVPLVKPTRIEPPPLPEDNSRRIDEFMNIIREVCDAASSSEELISDVMDTLVSEGPFERSALIVTGSDSRTAVTVAARGKVPEFKQSMVIEAPVSPLTQGSVKVQSFGGGKYNCSPFGSKAYALAPVDAEFKSPVVLYVDCGSRAAFSMDERKLFRLVIEVLNQKLPELEGSIPNDLGIEV